MTRIILATIAISAAGLCLTACDHEKEVARHETTRVESDGDTKHKVESTKVNTDTGEVTKTKTESKTDNNP